MKVSKKRAREIVIAGFPAIPEEIIKTYGLTQKEVRDVYKILAKILPNSDELAEEFCRLKKKLWSRKKKNPRR